MRESQTHTMPSKLTLRDEQDQNVTHLQFTTALQIISPTEATSRSYREPERFHSPALEFIPETEPMCQ